MKYYDAVMPLLSNILLNAQDKQVWGGGGLYLLLLTVVAGCVCVCVFVCLSMRRARQIWGEAGCIRRC